MITSRWLARASTTLAFGLTLGGCGGPARNVGPLAAPPPAVERPPAPPSPPTDPAGPPAPPAKPPPPPFAPRVPELAHFHTALWGLETRSRQDHVRVVWLGDSHGQADFWSGRLRSLLQARFGNGGPGYVALGYKNYRHGGVALEIDGKWRMRPKQPASAKQEGDGVFGLAGLLMGGYAGGPRVRLSLEPAPKGRVRYDVCVKPRALEDAIRVEAPGSDPVTFAPGDGAPLDQLAHVVTEGTAEGPLVVTYTGGSPSLCGAVVETDPQGGPGLVVDQLGFNGARYGTPLSWDEASWGAELARRRPDLVILEYGGNEAGDANPAYAKVGQQVEALMARIRKVRPETDCLVIAPTDRADAEERVPPMVASVKAAAGRARCAFFDAYEIMGGRGAMAARRDETKPRAQKDGVHMTIRGYHEIAVSLHEALLAGYEGPAPGTVAAAAEQGGEPK